MEQNLHTLAAAVLTEHGYSTAGLSYLGGGEQSACYGTGEVALLLLRPEFECSDTDLTGHSFADGPTSNDYAAIGWAAGQAARTGMRTPLVLATGDQPRPYALLERARGVPALTHPRVAEEAAGWFGHLGTELAKAHHVTTSGYGLFVPDGCGGYRGEFAGWTEYLDRWLEVNLCVGQSRPEDERALDALLVHRIVDECDLTRVAARVGEARSWPVRSVLTHYDNRLENLVVGEDGVLVLDWGLSLAGIGIAHELVKLFQTEPTSMASPRVAAFLHGYGLDDAECADAIEDGTLMLVLDGLSMAHGWAHDRSRLDGVRGWLHTVKRLAEDW